MALVGVKLQTLVSEPDALTTRPQKKNSSSELNLQNFKLKTNFLNRPDDY